MAETKSVKAVSSQNGSSGVAASSATIQGASNLVGQKVVFRQYPSGVPKTGTIASMQGENFALISEDGMPGYQLQLTLVTDILGIIAIVPFNAAMPSKAAAVSKAAPSKAAAVSKAAPSKAAPTETAPSKAAPTEAAAVPKAATPSTTAVSEAAFPELKATEAQLKAREAQLKARASPPKAAAVPKTAAAVPKTAAVSKTAAPKVSKRVIEAEIGDFVAAQAADACVNAELPTLLNHTVSGRKTVKFEFPATLRFDGQDVSVGANFNKPHVLEKLRENLGIESDKIRVSINYAFEHLPNGKLDVLKMGEITVFVSW